MSIRSNQELMNSISNVNLGDARKKKRRKLKHISSEDSANHRRGSKGKKTIFSSSIDSSQARKNQEAFKKIRTLDLKN
jgi:hypothetical protein